MDRPEQGLQSRKFSGVEFVGASLPWQHDRIMTSDLFAWWFFLCAVSGLNILAWAFSAAALGRRQAGLPPEVYALRRMQLVLSAGYVFGCAYRSVLPVYDVPRMCLFDSWFSSVIVGRSVATFAELCFVSQWALMLREMSRSTESSTGTVASALLLPCIVVAECTSASRSGSASR